MFSILHISDLHRSPSEPVDNDALLAALLADGNRYGLETPPVAPPRAIVVSGDIVQGTALDRSGSNPAAWRDVLKGQYRTAEDFLARLTDRFLHGDRSLLVMVPGNHDVCWNTAFRAMNVVPSGNIDGGTRAGLLRPGSTYRWSWDELQAYQVVDPDAYARRLDAYWDFSERFYAGFNLPRQINRAAGYNLFEVDEGRILIAAFESVYGNDCFSSIGAVPPDAVGRCALELSDLNRSHDLRIAVWHHSIQGPPNRDDYMDVSRVHELIGHGFRLGLHGH